MYFTDSTLTFINNTLGATIHMVCRNQTRGEEAKQDVIQQSGNDVSIFLAQFNLKPFYLLVVDMLLCSCY